MALDNRTYGILLLGFVAAATLLFADPIVAFLETALVRLSVIPALLVILITVVLRHRVLQANLDKKAQHDAELIADDVRRAEERARELEQIVRLSEALGATLDPRAIHQTVKQYLQPVIGQRELWMIVRAEGWRLEIGGLKSTGAPPDKPWDPRRQPGAWETFPMFAAGKFVGLMGVGQTVGDRPQVLTDSQRRLLEMAASLVGLSIKNAQLFRRVRQLSAVDDLTGFLTKHHGMNLIEAELHRAQRSEQPVSLLFIDLDHFKQLNDRYGHLFGDSVLETVGAVIRESLRASDLRCRYGGEEFVVLLPETPLDGAKRVAESLRRHLARKAIERPEGSIFVTASVGVSVAKQGELDPQALLSRADAAMYRAKRDGRNCVRIWEDYPEWRRSQVRESPRENERQTLDETSEPNGITAAPNWRILTDGSEDVWVDSASVVDHSDDWDEV